MEYIQTALGPRAWRYCVGFLFAFFLPLGGRSASRLVLIGIAQKMIQSLDGMKYGLLRPYIVFYAVESQDGRPFPVNKTVREIQGDWFRAEYAWRGDLVVAKYLDSDLSDITHATIADYPLVRNWLRHHGCPTPQGSGQK